MALRWYHKFFVDKADGIDSTLVKPSNWNDTPSTPSHGASTDTTSGIVIGKDNTGEGDLQELPFSYDPAKQVWSATGVTGGIIPPRGTTAQRPTTPTDGTIRFNTTTNQLEICKQNVWRSLAVSSSAFSAYLSGDLGVGPGGSVNLQAYVTTYDPEGSFDPANGVWTALTTGAYRVSTSANMSTDAGGAMRLAINKVGSVMVQGDTYSPGGPTSVGLSTIIYMVQGEWCRVQAINFNGSSGAHVLGGPHAVFSANYVGP